MASAVPPDATTVPGRLRVRVTGAVQGVGMRPTVHRIATALGLAGFVRNGPDGVVIEVEGAAVGRFVERLAAEAPPLARFDGITAEPVPPTGKRGFVILDSEDGPAATRMVPDAATCAACLAELFDPASRFHRYPFVNCTHCGPRHTITRRLPYDRRHTSMADFAMCEACAADYADPGNRRHHAEPIACPACGPRLSHSVETIAEALRSGRIVALKGIGGYHLMVDARDEEAVARLRKRKDRDAKPFAVMVANAASVPLVAEACALEMQLLRSPGSPIVLLEAVPGTLAPSVAPRLARVGVLLAYTPVHHLLFAALNGGGGDHDPAAPNPACVVATSANPGGEPLVIDDADAERRLAGIADLVVGHDRPIVIRADDGVMQIVAGAPFHIRRARGSVPDPVPLPADGPPVLALGAHLKNTVCVTRGREAFVSQHVGDLDTVETARFYRETIDHLLGIVGVVPEAIATDLHPDFLPSRIAEGFGSPVVRVQHHAAHVASVAAENGVGGPVLGLALDGHGLGEDGGNWGGELLRVDGRSWERLGHLARWPLPGGDRAAREPWRMGVVALHKVGRSDEVAARFPDRPFAPTIAGRLARGQELIETSSLGRLFDAVAALAGVCDVQDYEGQAAMELEALVRAPRGYDDGYTIRGREICFARTIRRALSDGLTAAEFADAFHGALIDGWAAFAALFAEETGIRTVALGGGCLMNRVLAEGLVDALAARGLVPLLPRHLPPNDGGLSYGQAVMARAALT